MDIQTSNRINGKKKPGKLAEAFYD